MNRSIRDGTPEMRTYAAMLGMTSDQLRDMFKSDPTEVLIRFTDAIKQGRPGRLPGAGVPGPGRHPHGARAAGHLRPGQPAPDHRTTRRRRLRLRLHRRGRGGRHGQRQREHARSCRRRWRRPCRRPASRSWASSTRWSRSPTSFAGVIHDIVASPLVQWLGTVSGLLRGIAAPITAVVTGLGALALGRQLLMGRRGEPVGGLMGMGRAVRCRRRGGPGRRGARRGCHRPIAAGDRYGRIIREPLIGPAASVAPGWARSRWSGAACVAGPTGSADIADTTDPDDGPADRAAPPYSEPGHGARERLRRHLGPGRGRADAGGPAQGPGGVRPGDQARPGRRSASGPRRSPPPRGSTGNLGGALARLVGQTGIAGWQWPLGGAVSGARQDGRGAGHLTPTAAAAGRRRQSRSPACLAMKHFNEETQREHDEEVRRRAARRRGDLQRLRRRRRHSPTSGLVSLAEAATARPAKQLAASAPESCRGAS